MVSPHRLSAGPAQFHEVEHSLLDGDREQVAHFVPEGGAQFVGVHLRHFDLTHHAPLAADPHNNVALREPALCPQAFNG